MRLARMLAVALAIVAANALPAAGQADTSTLSRLIAEAESLKFDAPAERAAIASAQSRASVLRFNLGTGIAALGGDQTGIDAYRYGPGALIPMTVDGRPVDPRSLVNAQAGRTVDALEKAGATPDELRRIMELLDPVSAFAAGEWTGSDIAIFGRYVDAGAISLDDLYALAVLLDHEVTMHDEALDAVLDRDIAYASKLDEIKAERARLDRLAKDAALLTEIVALIADTGLTEHTVAAVRDVTGRDIEEIDWWLTGLSIEGSDRIYYCPPRGEWTSVIGVDGTDRYFTPSHVCHAAVHAGVIDFDGGLVLLEFYPHEPDFEAVASTRNGVESGAYGWTNASTYSFVPVLR